MLDDSRTEFVSNVSHELKTPLTSMKDIIRFIADTGRCSGGVVQGVYGDLSEEIERENKIINDLLSLVKMDKTADTMNISSVNINTLVERILKTASSQLRQKNNIEVVF